MIQNGLYRVHFQTQRGMGAGVIYINDGELRGGDSGLYYVGSVSTSGDELKATVSADRHTRHPGIQSVFGIDKFTIDLHGRQDGKVISCKGTSPQAPGIEFDAFLEKLSD